MLSGNSYKKALSDSYLSSLVKWEDRARRPVNELLFKQ